MDCRQFEWLISDYIAGKLEPDVLQEFLQHASSCHDCYEELEISYSVMQGIRELDNESSHYDQNLLSLDTSLYFAEERVRNWTIGRVIRYALSTVAFWSVLCTLWLQIQIWMR
jgi:hypothetical protein